MDEAAVERVVRFSIHLKKYADVLLGRQGIVAVDAWTLYEIEEAFSLIVEAEQLTDFLVLPPNHRQHPAIPHIQFLYDILQKVKKLKILTVPRQTLPSEQQINLKCFRNLHSLDLQCLPAQQLKGLQNLRPVLKSLTCCKVCTQLEDVLGKCGADQSTDYAWENLKVAVFSHNPLKTLDNSVHLLTSIKVLDLSYCELENVSALFCLSIVSKLDLSYNNLASVPLLSEAASNSLTALDLANNMIVDIRGIENFPNLEELDLRENFISLELTLIHLTGLPQLNYINMMRNPIAYSINYRLHVLKYLNPNAKLNQELVFDESLVDYHERKVIGTAFELAEPVNTGIKLLKFLTDRVSNLVVRLQNNPATSSVNTVISEYVEDSLTDSLNINLHLTQTLNCKKNLFHSAEQQKLLTAKDSKRRKNKRNRTRHVSIANPEDLDEVSDICVGVPRRLLSASYSSPNNLGQLGENHSQMLPTQELERSHLVPEEISINVRDAVQCDKLLEEILHSEAGQLEDESFTNIKSPSSYGVALLNKSYMESSMISSTNSSICKAGGTYSRQSSQDLSPIPTDDEDIEPNRENYSVIARWEHKLNDRNVHVDSEYAFVSFSDYYYKEKNALTYGTMVKMCVSSLINMEVLSVEPIKVQLCFNQINPELCSRIFTLEAEQYERLKKLVDPVLERNTADPEFISSPVLCRKCGTVFKGLIAPVSGDNGANDDYCRYCGNYTKSKQVASTQSENDISIYSTPPCDSADPHSKRETSLPKCNGSKKHKREKSSAQSSDTSESFSVCSSDVSSGVPRESDLEVISNPSLSSIEVLADHLQEREGNLAGQFIEHGASMLAVINIDARTPPQAEEILKVENKVLTTKQESATMQESSSSGSMTGSVCTAVDRLSSGPDTPLKVRDEYIKNSECQDVLDETVQISTFADTTLPTNGEDTDCVFSISTSSETHYLSTSAKSTDTLCHHPTLQEALSSISIYDAARKGIIIEEKPDSELEGWLCPILSGFTGYYWIWWKELSSEAYKPINTCLNSYDFNYEDFSQVDHRLELFADMFLFKEDNERLQGIIKAVIAVESDEPFVGLMIVSDCKLYILKINESQDDSPHSWLGEKFSREIHYIGCIYTLLFELGIALQMKEKKILLCLADPIRTEAVYNFIAGVLKTHYVNCKHEEYHRSQEENLLKQLAELGYLTEENHIEFFQLISLLQENGTTLHCFLLVTSTYVFLFDADLNWLFPREANNEKFPSLKLRLHQRVDDVTKMHVLTDTIMQLNFYGEVNGIPKDPWMFHVPSATVGCHLITTIRNLWMKLYKVEFDIICSSSELRIVREVLRDSSFSSYIK